jgi:hypothetical protein
MVTKVFRTCFGFPVLLSIIVLCAFWVLREQCLNSELQDQECLVIAEQPIDALRQMVSTRLGRLSVQSYITFAVSLGLAGLVVVTLVSCVAGTSSLWSFLYAASIAFSLVGERAAFHRQPWNTIYFQLAALVLGFLSLLIVWWRNNGNFRSSWIAPGSYSRNPTPLEVGGVLLIFALIISTRFYALNRLPGLWDAEGCPHRAIAASLYHIMDQELGAHVQQSSGMSWVMIHHLFNRVTDPLMYLLGERFIGVGISLLNCLVVYLLMLHLRGHFAAILALMV